MDKKSLWIGIGIGVTTGVATGFIIGNQVTKRKARQEIKRVRHTAYIKGQQDAEAEARKVIDELTENVVFVDSTASAEDIKKAVDLKSAELSAELSNALSSDQTNHTEKGTTEQREGETFVSPTPVSGDDKRSAEATADQISAELRAEREEKKAKKKSKKETAVESEAQFPPTGQYEIRGQYAVFFGAAGKEIYYPRSLILDEKGCVLDDIRIRKNFRMYESDIQKLRVIWNAMGWGTYIPDLDGDPLDEDIDNWDLSISDDEPEEKSEEREKYLEKVSRYIADPDAKPKIISRREFEEECHLEKVYIDYYDVDHVFVENTNPNEPVDAVTLLGTNDGEALFGMKVMNEEENDMDPDIINVENFKMNSVIEVTRYHKSYASVQDGSAYV